MKKSFSMFLMLFCLFACTPEADSNVPVNIVDQNQTISRDNAQFNAKRFVNERMVGSKAIAQSDSSINKNCRYGDGWASVEVFSDQGVKQAELKCQTNGSGKGLYGCLFKKDFMEKDYAKEEGVCQHLTDLPKFSSQS